MESTEYKPSVLFQALAALWIIMAFAIWGWSQRLIVTPEDRYDPDTHIGYTNSHLKTTRNIEGASFFRQFFWEYYTLSEEYDYSSDSFGDRQSPVSKGTVITWLLALILFLVAAAFDARKNLAYKVVFWGAIAILFAVNMVKAEFLLWASH